MNKEIIILISKIKYVSEEKLPTLEVECSECKETGYLSDETIKRMKSHYPDTDFNENPPVLICLECSGIDLKDLKRMAIERLGELTDKEKELFKEVMK